jgi:phosphoglycerol transferase
MSFLPALVVSLLFAFLPYHFLRLLHLFLASYYLIPLLVMVVLWIYIGRLPFFRCLEGEKPRWQILNGRNFVAVMICILVGSGGIYYAFFGCFFLLIAGAACCLERRNLHALWSAGILIAIIGTIIACNLFPHFAYIKQHGPNLEAGQRYHFETEAYGLRIVQLLLPIEEHKLAPLADLRARYDATTPLVNENGKATLGFIGSAGFLLLLGRLLCRRRAGDLAAPKDGLAVLNVFAVLLASMGGFGSLFGLLVSPQIRAYNRISIFIAFFSLFAIGLLLDQMARKSAESRYGRWAFQGFLVLLLFAGLRDQTTWRFVPDYAQLKSAFQQEKSFVRTLEAALPSGAMILQLPYMSFPEHGPATEQLRDYDLFRCYLQSTHLRWSYGCMKGRAGDLAQRMLATRDLPDMLRTIALAGYSGLHIDRRGYEDGAAALETSLTALLSAEPLRSGDGLWLFYNLAGYTERLRQSGSPGEWEAARQAALHPVTASWASHFNGVSGAERDFACHIHWANTLLLENQMPYTRRLFIEVTCVPNGDIKTLFLDGTLISRKIDVREMDKAISLTVDVPPGRHNIGFRCEYRQGVPTPREKLVLPIQRIRFRDPR